MAQEKVTLWTSSYFQPVSKSGDEKGVGCYFESSIFSEVSPSPYPSQDLAMRSPKTIVPHLEECLTSVQNYKAALIVIAHIEGDPRWLGPAFSEAFVSLPPSFFSNLVEARARGPGSVTLPSASSESRSMSFLLHYPMVRTITEDLPRDGATPVIIIACSDGSIPTKLQEHCVSGNWKVSALCKCPARVFIDLEMMFAEWSLVWNMARQDLVRRSAQVYGETRKISVLSLTQDLHRDASKVISLQEDLRLHSSALQKYQNIIWQPSSLMSELIGKDERGILEDNIEECSQNLQHQQESSIVIYKQLENLLSLAFNTEMVSQGQAVGRLNMLAFSFLPLSFVAAVFGMTNFSVSSRWYPLWAAVVFVIVLVAFFLADRFPKYRSKLRSKSRAPSKYRFKNTQGNSGALKPSRKGKERCTDPVNALEEGPWPENLTSSYPDHGRKIEPHNVLSLSGAGIPSLPFVAGPELTPVLYPGIANQIPSQTQRRSVSPIHQTGSSSVAAAVDAAASSSSI